MNKAGVCRLSFLVVGLSLACAQAATAASLSVYLSAPDVQSTSISGATTADFNSPGIAAGKATTSYSTPIGTYAFTSAAPGGIEAADQYGGANGTQYLAVGSQSGSNSGVTLNLNTSNNYFGFWFSAGDSKNEISFYNNTTLLATYNVQTILTLLGNSTVTAINGTVYNSSTYFGNPNTAFLNMNSSQPYSYVDIVANGVTFNKIVLDNSGSQSTGFESDNHSVYSGTVVIPNADVFVTTISAVPEPSQYVIMLGGVIFCLVTGQRLLKKFRVDTMPVSASLS